MKLLFKQRIFSWFDSYDIYDEQGKVVYQVKGELAWGHQLRIYDYLGREVGLVKQQIFTFLPKFDIYERGNQLGTICKEFSLFRPCYHFDGLGWKVEGNFFEWDYTITNCGMEIATISKQLFNWSDTYVIDVVDDNNALYALMFVLAIDAEKCSRDNNN